MFKNFDFLILFSIVFLSIFGLVILWSVVPALFPQQLLFILIGLVVYFVFSFIDHRIYPNLSIVLYAFSILSLLITFIFGEVTRGSTRWIQIGTFTIQSSEIIKPFLILFVASAFSKLERFNIAEIIPTTLLFLVPLTIVFLQPDLGSTLVTIALFAGMIWALGPPRKSLVISVFVSVVIIPLVWFFLKDYQKARVLSFLNPYSDPLGSGYHVIQSVIAVGSGQLFGRGLGHGTQSHLAFLPERHTDFVFASFAEEFGLIGAALLITFYFLLLYRILKIARSSTTRFGAFICYGVFSMLIFQVFVNIGMNIGLLPITGITLPLVSYGGSSILSVLICLGLVESVSRSQSNQDVIEIR